MNDFYNPNQEPDGNLPPQSPQPPQFPQPVPPQYGYPVENAQMGGTGYPKQGVYSTQAPPPQMPPQRPQQYLPPPPAASQPPQGYYSPYYQQPVQPPPPPPPMYPVYYQPVDEKRGLAIASMVLGIVSLVFFCLPFMSVPLSIAAVVLGCFALKSSMSKGLAIAGIICGGVTLMVLLLSVGGAMLGDMWWDSWDLFDYWY